MLSLSSSWGRPGKVGVQFHAFLTSAPEVSGQIDNQPALPQETNPVPIECEAGWAQEPIWTILEMITFPVPSEIRNLYVLLVA